MKNIYRTYQFALSPTSSQKEKMEKHFGCVRFVYNYFLNQHKDQYQLKQKTDNFKAKSLKLTQIKNEFLFLKEVDANCLQQSLRHLDSAFQSFYSKKNKFPCFKSKKTYNSFNIQRNISIKDNKLFFSHFREGIKVIFHRQFEGIIKNCTISKQSGDKYFVSILTEESFNSSIPTSKMVGIDLGIHDFAVTSENKRYANPKFTKKYQLKLASSQKHLSRKKLGSHSFEKQKRKVALIHKKISNSRKDHLHKISHELILNYDVIFIEDLNVKGLIQNHKLSKAINDASWSKFVSFLQYKANWNDKKIIRVNRFFPSSKMCSLCGHINHDLKLSNRDWVCRCNKKIDRDFNAAQNIFNEGFKILKSAGPSDYRT